MFEYPAIWQLLGKSQDINQNTKEQPGNNFVGENCLLLT